MMHPTQDPKYSIAGSDGGPPHLVNTATGKPIPKGEPIFIFRAKDKNALRILRMYCDECGIPDHKAAVDQRISEFEAFAEANPELMKEPDTDTVTPEPGSAHPLRVEISYNEAYAMHQYHWGQFKYWYARVYGMELKELNVELANYEPKPRRADLMGLSRIVMDEIMGSIRALQIKTSALKSIYEKADRQHSVKIDDVIEDAIADFRAHLTKR